jgi:glycosyltransferase involved in cell wall biosynthesis
MKVLHVPFCYWPDAAGGTEVYVESLAREQLHQGFEVMVAAPGTEEQKYVHHGVQIRRFPVAQQVQDVRDVYGEGDAVAAEAFGRVLDTAQPDIVHLHAFTRGVSLRVARAAKQRGIPVVFSYHTPTVSCPRGTLMHWGAEVCDGVLQVEKCSQCTLHGLGLDRSLSALAGLLPQSVGRALGSRRLSGGIWTALRMTDLVALQHAVFRALMSEVDHVVALCGWVKELLLRNGVPEEKVTISRQGLPEVESDSTPPSTARTPAGRIRIVFLGRLDPAKGIHILTQAMRAVSEVPIDLDIYGIVQGEAGAAYLRKLKHSAQSDPRISFRDPVPAGVVVPKLREYDVVAVPSQCLETGPMVVLEAFAAGVPVIGSNLGGIAELVTNGVNGLLVEPCSVGAWIRVLRKVSDDPRLLNELRSNMSPPRRISQSAHEMAEVYRALLPQEAHA